MRTGMITRKKAALAQPGKELDGIKTYLVILQRGGVNITQVTFLFN